MRVLILNKMDDRDEFIIEFGARIGRQLNAEIHLLNIVQVPGEIPVKQNGQILDVCTEFDLSGYLKQQRSNKERLANYLSEDRGVVKSSIVGAPMAILEDYVKNNQIDLVVSGAHVTTNLEDMFSATFASRAYKKLKVPYLTLKCDRSWMKINRIALVRDFKNPKQENLEVFKAIQEAFDAELLLGRINTPKDQMNEELALKGMEIFARENGLKKYKPVFIESESKEAGIEQMIVNNQVCILAMGQFERKGILSFLNGDVRNSVVNHVAAPLYIY